MRKHIFTFILLFLMGNSIFAQPWQRVVGGPRSNIGHNLTYNFHNQFGGVLIHSKPGGNYRPSIVSFNNKGDSIFSKEINLDSLGSPTYIIAIDVKIDGFGNRIVNGKVDFTINSSGFNYVWFTIKYDSLGSLVQMKKIADNFVNPTNDQIIISKTNHVYHFIYLDSLVNGWLSGTGSGFDYSHLLVQEIHKYDNNGNFIWKKRWTQADTSIGTNNLNRIGFIINPIELANGNIMYFRWDTTMFNGAQLETINPSGQITSTLLANNYLVSNSGNGNSFAGKDTTLNLAGWRASPTNSTIQQGYILKIKPTGQIVDSLILSYFNFSSITQKSNGQVLVSYYYFPPNSNNYTQGILVLNKHLSILNNIPAQSLELFSDIIVSNGINGCVMAGYIKNPAYTGDHTTLICNYDSLFNTYPSKLTGNINLDNNKDCNFNSGDSKLPYRSIVCTDAQNKSFYAYSNANGNYTVAVPNNNYTVTHSPGNYKSIICPSLNPTFTFSNNSFNQNFFDTIVPNINDLKITLISDPFWIGGNGYISAMYENVGTKTVSARVKLIKNAALSFSFSVPSPNNISADTIIYNFTSLAPDSIGFVTLCLTPSSNLSFGTALNFKAIISNTLSDADLNNNQDSLTNTFYGALKVASPSLSVSTSNNLNVNKPLYINGTEELTYKIRFQNTCGNAVKDVMIVDTLSPFLDYSTLKIVSASAAYNFNLNANGKLILSFKNINLQDSAANENASKGFVIYRIKPKASWRVGQRIHNQANIYFDYFDVKTTNQTNNLRLNTLGINKAAFTSSEGVQIYPNPSNGFFIIDKNENINVQLIKVYSISGQELLSLMPDLNASKNNLDLSNLEHGFYILKLSTSLGIITKKIIIEK